MATTIKLKNSVTTTNAPSSLVQGEVAINITDKKVWVGNAATTPIQLLGDGGTASFTSIAFGAGTVSNPSITFTGDTNTGIYSPAADTIAFTEGGVESVRIDSSGNVGIGVTNPSAYSKLTVLGPVTSGEAVSTNGSTLLRGYYGTGALTNIGTMFASGGPVLGYGATGSKAADNQLISTTTVNVPRQAMYMNGNDFIYYTAPAQTTAVDSTLTSVSEIMRLTGAGNLGLGTNNPTTKIHAEGTIQARIGSTGVQIYGDGGAGYVNSVGAFPLILQTNSVERARIDTSGNILVNTTTASYSAANRGNITIGGTNSAILGFQKSGVNKGYVYLDPSDNIQLWNESNTSTIFATNATERMRINGSGNVGIGTNNPSYKLDVPAESNFNGIRIGLNGDTINASNSLLAIRINNTERIRVNSVGDVGIGTTAPQNKLQVLVADTGNVVGASAASMNVTNSNSGAFGRTMDYQLSIGAGGSSEKIAAISGVYTNFSTSVGGAIAFATNNGSSSFAERMRITSDGLLQFNSGFGSVATAYGCRAWVRFNGTGTPAINGSGNVSSITDNGTGDYKINFTSNMTDVNFTVAGAAKTSDNNTAGLNNIAYAPYSFATSSVSVLTMDANNATLKDCAVITAVIFR